MKECEGFQGRRRAHFFASLFFLVLFFFARREMEAKDAAKVALRCPCWTIAPNYDDLEKVIKIAGWVPGSKLRRRCAKIRLFRREAPNLFFENRWIAADLVLRVPQNDEEVTIMALYPKLFALRRPLVGASVLTAYFRCCTVDLSSRHPR